MFIQPSVILFLAKFMTDNDEVISLPEREDPQRRNSEMARGEFVLRTCRLASRT